MDEFTELLENFWFIRENDGSEYFRIKRAIDNPMKKFLGDFVGWKIIVNNKIVKLEKTPAEAKPSMGIQCFESTKDYCLLCALLVYLDDKFEGEQFLLTEMIENIEKIIGSTTDIDFTKFSDRKSLVRVLKFAHSMYFIKISDGSLENLESDINKQILYENTGLSSYFSVNHDIDIFDFESYKDFEKRTDIYINNDTGYARTNRVYRKLILQPAMYWESKDDPDSIYLKNQRASIGRYLEKYLNGRLDIHNGAAFYMLNEDYTFGKIHPADNSLSGFVALFCGELKEEKGIIESGAEKHKYYFDEYEFKSLILKYKEKFKEGIGKQLREMNDSKFISEVEKYLLYWQLAEKTDGGYYFRDGIFKTAGIFPKNFVFENVEEEK